MKTSNHILAILLALLMSLPGLIAQDTEGQQLKPIDEVKAEGFGLATVTNGDMVVVSTRMTRILPAMNGMVSRNSTIPCRDGGCGPSMPPSSGVSPICSCFRPYP